MKSMKKIKGLHQDRQSGKKTKEIVQHSLNVLLILVHGNKYVKVGLGMSIYIIFVLIATRAWLG